MCCQSGDIAIWQHQNTLFTAVEIMPSEKTLQFIRQASLLYKDNCPEQSRFFMQRHQMEVPDVPETVVCPFCFQWRQPDNHRVRLRPKRKPSVRIQQLLRKEAAGRRLSLEQKDILRRFRNSSNTLMATCNTCSKTSRRAGVNRDLLASLSKSSQNTPASSGRRKAHYQPLNSGIATTPKSGSGAKTPNGTPRSISSESTGSSASKSGSVKKSAFSRLKKLLMVDDNQKSEKRGLKDFLSSL
ncbi:UPF0711 protein C18orf21 homolog [Chanos chanos]|uniref:UPF0711 protein C18orf21 homolog n=1 Tax=Chanos chanos TaxID=29144 RepID=A0A6J2WM46_CHACN|nr:UPF0711 protein C18orf21 homolog [Chanos chanos]